MAIDEITAGPGAAPPPLPSVPARQQTPGPSSGPLSDADLLLVRQATIRRKAVRRAAAVARASAISTLAIGIAGLMVAMAWPGWSSFLVAAGVCAVGAVEYVGHLRMRRAQASAPRLLALNQLAFVAIITLYCIVQMATFSTQSLKDSAISPEFRDQMTAMPSMTKSIDQEIDQWAPWAMYGFYGLVIVVSALCQGGLALYYFTRRHHVRSFNEQTPQWIQRLMIETL